MGLKTSDLCDVHADRLQIARPIFFHFGGRTGFSGMIETVTAPGDNSKLRECIAKPGQGRVLVVDGGGGLCCALLGDQLGGLAAGNQWSGIVIHGCVRDSEELAQIPLGVMALAVHPKKSDQRGRGEIHLPLLFAGVTFYPGHYLYADRDGLIVSPSRLEGA